MLLQQIVDNANPLAYWTGENIATGNVYDEYTNHTLINNNATLGAPGSSNPSISSRSINLNSGYLQLLDATFTNSQLIDKNLSIQFGFRIPNRTKDNPIAGFHPIISKWVPDQQWAIVIENGIISAKVDTADGLLELDFDYPDIIYNDRWNFVQLQIRSGVISLHVNGCKSELSYSSIFSPSNSSLMTIGGQGADQFTNDILIADISITNSFGDTFAAMMYTFPRTAAECILNFNPTHYYDLLAAPAPTSAHINRGTAGGKGYIVYSGEAPSKTVVDDYLNEECIRFPPGCKFTIDTIPSMNFTAGFSLLVRGDITASGMESNNGALTHDMIIMDARNSMLNNNGRFLLSYNRSSNSREYFGWVAYDESGTVVSPTSLSYFIGDSAHTHFQYGTKCFTFGGTDVDFNDTLYYNQTLASEFNQDLNYNPPIQHNYIDIWRNVSTTQAQVSHIALYDYKLPADASTIISPPKFRMISEFMASKYEYYWLIYGMGGNISYIAGPELFESPVYTSVGISYVNVLDPLNNRQNKFTKSIFIPNSNSLVGGRNNEDNLTYLNGMTTYGFFWNRNRVSRYQLLLANANVDFVVWMNSRNGVFSYGDVEVMYDKDVPDSHLSTTSRTFVDDGFHFLAIVRVDTVLQIWVDGVVETSKVMVSTPPIAATNNIIRAYGGPVYVNDFGSVNASFNETDIALIYQGFQDYIEGQCTLDGAALPSVLLATDVHTGRVMKKYSTDINGNFKAFLPKSLDGESVTILALAQDDNVTNNVVAHGPYNLQTTYRKYAYETTVDSYSDMVLGMSPYAYYPMNETSGTTIVDASGNGRDGSAIGGITLNQDGPSDGMSAIQFDGVDGYIDLPDGYADFSEGFTFELWANITDLTNYFRYFELASGLNGANSFTLGNVSETTTLYVKNYNPSSEFNYSNGITLNAWQMITVRYTPSGLTSIWINGVKVAEDTLSAPTNITRTEAFIGRETFAGYGYLTGKVSNFAAYQFPLPDEEIERHSARVYQLPVQTLKSMIQQDTPSIYFTFDRLIELVNQTDQDVTWVQNGTFEFAKNAIGINTGVVGNNYLVTDDVSLNNVNSNGWTIEVSFKSVGTQIEAILIAEWQTNGTDTGTFKLQLNNSNLISFHVNNPSTQLESTTLYNDGNWHHVVIVNDGLDTITMYVDGVSEDTLSSSMTYGIHDFSIGNSSDGASATATEVPTYLDDLAIYDYALNPSRITDHYNQFIKKKVYQ